MPRPATAPDPWLALADPTRREVLARVAERPRSVTAIAAELPVSRPAVSQHLKVLKEARLVRSHRDGKQQIYSARPDGLAELRAELDSFWGEALASLKEIAESPDLTEDAEKNPAGDEREQR